MKLKISSSTHWQLLSKFSRVTVQSFLVFWELQVWRYNPQNVLILDSSRDMTSDLEAIVPLLYSVRHFWNFIVLLHKSWFKMNIQWKHILGFFYYYLKKKRNFRFLKFLRCFLFVQLLHHCYSVEYFQSIINAKKKNCHKNLWGTLTVIMPRRHCQEICLWKFLHIHL